MLSMFYKRNEVNTMHSSFAAGRSKSTLSVKYAGKREPFTPIGGMTMKKNNLKAVATCLSILISFVFFGCAEQDMTLAMDKSMEPAMEKPMDTNMDESMNKDMGTMNEQKMGGAMDEMKSDAAKDGVGGMKDKKMIPEQEKMME